MQVETNSSESDFFESASDAELEKAEYVLQLQEAIWNEWPLIYEVLLGHQVEWFHEEWVNFQLENPWTILLGPREFGKTQTCVKDYAILKSLRSRNERILILSKTLRQATDILREIRLHLEQNLSVQIFGKFFEGGPLRSQKSATELSFLGRTEIFSEPNVAALGIGGTLISGHYSIILGDDLVDSRNASGKNANLLYNWLKQEVIPMLLPNGEFHIIGSTWGEKDPYRRLIKETQEGKLRFKWRIYSAEDEKRNSIWPDFFPTEELRQREADQKTPFYRAQYCNDPRLLDRTRKLFFEEDVQRRLRSEVMRRIQRIVIGVDPATGGGESWHAFTILGEVAEDPDWPRYWIIDQFKEKFGSDESFDLLRAAFRKYPQIEVVVVESVGFQLDFANRLSAVFPIEKRHTQVSKKSRHERVGGLFQQGTVGCCEECWELMQDFWEYPSPEMDLIDSFDLAWSALWTAEEGEYDEVDLRTKEEKRMDKYRKRRKREYKREISI